MNPMNRRAFTLLEMLLATALAAVLMAAVLLMLTGVARDQKHLNAAAAAAAVSPSAAPPSARTLVDRMRWDIVNAETIDFGRDGSSVVLIGHGAIDRQSLTGNARFCQVTYRLASGCLTREQQYLDNPAQPARWRELVASDVRGFRIAPESTDAFPADENGGVTSATAVTVPSRIRLNLEAQNVSIDQELWIK
jgi:prepilin-type N-terminal cleavage/methylation domain-containing protein